MKNGLPFAKLPETRNELDRLIKDWTRKHYVREIMETLQSAGIRAGASFKVEDLVADPHLRERGFFVEVEQPKLGKKPLPGLPWRLGKGVTSNYRPAPLIGQDNDYVFSRLLGMPDGELARLVEEMIIY